MNQQILKFLQDKVDYVISVTRNTIDFSWFNIICRIEHTDSEYKFIGPNNKFCYSASKGSEFLVILKNYYLIHSSLKEIKNFALSIGLAVTIDVKKGYIFLNGPKIFYLKTAECSTSQGMFYLYDSYEAYQFQNLSYIFTVINNSIVIKNIVDSFCIKNNIRYEIYKKSNRVNYRIIYNKIILEIELNLDNKVWTVWKNNVLDLKFKDYILLEKYLKENIPYNHIDTFGFKPDLHIPYKKVKFVK